MKVAAMTAVAMSQGLVVARQGREGERGSVGEDVAEALMGQTWRQGDTESRRQGEGELTKKSVRAGSCMA